MIKIKRILKFYFRAEQMNDALDCYILRRALSSFDTHDGGLKAVDKITNLIDKKILLAKLWAFLDGVINKLDESDVAVLEKYALMRCGIYRLGESERRQIRRVVVKFTRRIDGKISRFEKGVEIIDAYFCLLNFGMG